ncbi:MULTISPECIES: hypothetical protein [Pseudomonas]|uniref:hypothetical protein n=1 Tax=Pseudomonas TaxID=286 RepID=UPI0013DF82E9|nr:MULTISPECIES: hypothetical protein [Pseudomonas]MCE0912568.1 hypothetical protein [Pseudomonas kurunegalensis]QIG18762.1 hypothetical protein FY041_13880 [Pseudomonas monteilii]QIG24017.1 hypothetical protein FY043_13875 [Pseudomonas monteilii]WJR58512.1 hypothetical protein LU664_013545 [Pseudomonas kurunegalensis]
MVAKIQFPEHDSVEVIARLADERRSYRAFYDKFKPDWLLASKAYIDHSGCPLRVTPLNLMDYTGSEEEAKARKESLLNLYTPKETQFQYELLASLRRNHGLIFCPCCGSHSVPGTLDHYLPKTSFPEFAVLLANLTPMCNACQEDKGASYLTEEGNRKFIHSYFDDINFSLYKINFEGDLSKPEFVFEFESDLPIDYAALVKEHVKGVNIPARFLSFCETKYLHLLKTAKRLRDGGKTAELEMVLGLFLTTAEENSVNCWEAIFHRSVLASETLMVFLREGDLPQGL